MAVVLVAEDNPEIRGLITAALGLAGHQVVAAKSGTEAIDALHGDHVFDLVITDYSMPGADGIAVITEAQVVDPTLPCVIVTAFHDLELAMRGMRAGAVGFVPKPFKPEHLMMVARTAIERREMAAEVMRLRVLTPMLERFTMLLANTLESKDLSTGRHSERLAVMADTVGAAMGLDLDQRLKLRLGAGLHDVGKVAVPQSVLNKVEALDDADIAVLRTHPDVGASILASSGVPDEVRLIIRHHHERYDGGGYPSGLAGAEIPLGARIVGAVDAVDVMLHGRVYVAAKSPEEVIAELIRNRRRHFDPDVVDAVIGCIEQQAVLAS